ncbi:MAG: hypothetical protein K6A79_09340 [Ruminococcus sp.]|nr:hypothetical protein [Ruminococcus sp.]MCR5075988.1 hypothetical protein [Ruminococcus sp.]
MYSANAYLQRFYRMLKNEKGILKGYPQTILSQFLVIIPQYLNIYCCNRN